MFLDFYDNCDTSSLPSSLDTLADTCRGTVRTHINPAYCSAAAH